MNDKFDELAKGLAQSVTRRGALEKFGVGLAGLVLAALGLTSRAEADQHRRWVCTCVYPFLGCKSGNGGCYKFCLRNCSGG